MFHLKYLVSGIVLAGLTMTSAAHARVGGRVESKTYTLKFNGQQFQGQGNNIHLKQQLISLDRSLRGKLDDAQIEAVEIMAKSRAGSGTAELLIKQRLVDSKSILQADRGNFKSNLPRTYNNIDFRVPRRQNQGAWVLKLYGNIKVHNIRITVQLNQRGPSVPPAPRVENRVLGTLNLPAIFPTFQNFQVGENVKSIKVKALNNPVQMINLTLEYQNGQRTSMPEFQVFLFPGQELEININNNRIVRRVMVTASSFGGNGQLRLWAKVQN